MLQFLRKQIKNFFIKIIFGILILIFILYFGFIQNPKNNEILATVNGQIITKNEFYNRYNEILARIEKYLPNNENSIFDKDYQTIVELKQKVLNELINDKIMKYFINFFSLHISNEEIRNIISSNPIFQKDKIFNFNYYTFILNQNNITLEKFESIIREELLNEKLKQLLVEGIILFNPEWEQFNEINNEYINLEFIQLDWTLFKKKVKFSEENLKLFFRKNINEFKTLTIFDIEYIVFPFVKVVKDKNLTEKEKKSQLTEKIVKKVFKEIQQTKNFKNYVLKNKLPIYKIKNISEKLIPKKFKNIFDILSSLKVKEISIPIKLDNRFYIFHKIRQQKSYIPSFLKIKDKVKNLYFIFEANKLAKEETDKIFQKIKQGISFKEIATTKKLKIVETGLFKIGSHNIPRITNNTDNLSILLCNLSKKNPFLENIIYNNGKYFIIKFKNRSFISTKNKYYEKQFKLKYEKFRKEYFYKLWLDQIREKFQKLKKIKINKDFNQI